MHNVDWSRAPKRVKDLLEQAAAEGYEIRRGGNNHWKVLLTPERTAKLLELGFDPVKVPDSKMVSVGSSPAASSTQNAIHDLRRIGFDYENWASTVKAAAAEKPEKLNRAEIVGHVVASGKTWTVRDLTAFVVEARYGEALENTDKRWLSTRASVHSMLKTATKKGHLDTTTRKSPNGRVVVAYKAPTVETVERVQKTDAYVEERQSENRADCTNCGLSDAKCTDRVIREHKEACCSRCKSTDTHPPIGSEKEKVVTAQREAAMQIVAEQQAAANAELHERAAQAEATHAELKEAIDYIMLLPIGIIEDEACRAQLTRLRPLVNMATASDMITG